eukprot:scaffold349544_cov15-Prasinocladus_malaysianus.AAC.1
MRRAALTPDSGSQLKARLKGLKLKVETLKQGEDTDQSEAQLMPTICFVCLAEFQMYQDHSRLLCWKTIAESRPA